MQPYFEPEQAFSISMPQPVCEISITYKKKQVCMLQLKYFDTGIPPVQFTSTNVWDERLAFPNILNFTYYAFYYIDHETIIRTGITCKKIPL